jgi:hypothetical protein
MNLYLNDESTQIPGLSPFIRDTVHWVLAPMMYDPNGMPRITSPNRIGIHIYSL